MRVLSLSISKSLKKIICFYFVINLVFFNFFLVSRQIFAQENEVKESASEASDSTLIGSDELGVLKGRVSKVPSGTKLKIIVETPIDESTSKVGDEFTARTTDDLTIDENVVVPGGSTVSGQITEVNLAKRFHRAGSVRIEFKNLTTPDGRQIPIVASVLTRSGLLKGKYTTKRALIAGATIAGPAAAGFGAGLAAEGSPLGGGIGATLGLVAGIALFAFQRGNPVDIKAGDEFEIELTEDVLVPQAQEKLQEDVIKESIEEEKAGEKDFTEKDFTEETQPKEEKEVKKQEESNEHLQDKTKSSPTQIQDVEINDEGL